MDLLVDVHGHRPELEDAELPHVRAETRLPEEDRARRVALDPEGRVREERRRENQTHQGAEDVDRALEQAGRRRQPHGREADEGEAFDGVNGDPRADELVEPRHDVDLQVEIATGADDGEDVFLGFVRERDDHTLDVQQPHDVR